MSKLEDLNRMMGIPQMSYVGKTVKAPSFMDEYGETLGTLGELGLGAFDVYNQSRMAGVARDELKFKKDSFREQMDLRQKDYAYNHGLDQNYWNSKAIAANGGSLDDIRNAYSAGLNQINSTGSYGGLAQYGQTTQQQQIPQGIPQQGIPQQGIPQQGAPIQQNFGGIDPRSYGQV